MVDTVISRHRPLALLAAVVMAQLLLLAFQIKRDHDVRLIRYWAAAVVTPFERGGTWSLSKLGGIWSGYVALRGAKAENVRLHSQLAQLELRNRELASQAAEAQRLSVLLNFRESHPEAPMLAAQVIGASADPASHTLVLNRGEHDRVRRNMAVITPDGIVGKIVEVFPNTSQVLLISDRDSGVGALLADTRTHGVVKGNGDPVPRLDYVVNDEKVRVGEWILTSGEDRIFPKGLMIGTVSGATDGNPFQMIRIEPSAHLDRLEDVIILLSQQELTPKRGDESADSSAGSANPSGIVQIGALSARQSEKSTAAANVAKPAATAPSPEAPVQKAHSRPSQTQAVPPSPAHAPEAPQN
ncbi:MAG TPA: rod shape-determining protein MreC [Candidatus Acidoferrales bacterium]|nr:rod shape-determining protein MreC [Candidatus Acidoferrales bacterium]